MKKNKVIIAMARGVPENPTIARLRLKIMNYNKRVDDRCASGKIVSDNDADISMVAALRHELAQKSAKLILGNSPK